MAGVFLHARSPGVFQNGYRKFKSLIQTYGIPKKWWTCSSVSPTPTLSSLSTLYARCRSQYCRSYDLSALLQWSVSNMATSKTNVAEVNKCKFIWPLHRLRTSPSNVLWIRFPCPAFPSSILVCSAPVIYLVFYVPITPSACLSLSPPAPSCNYGLQVGAFFDNTFSSATFLFLGLQLCHVVIDVWIPICTHLHPSVRMTRCPSEDWPSVHLKTVFAMANC